MSSKYNYPKRIYILLPFFAMPFINSTAQVRYSALLADPDKTLPAQAEPSLRIAADNKGNETSKAFFQFSFANLPLSAKVGQLNLKMYRLPSSTSLNFSSQTITVFWAKAGWSGAGSNLTDADLNWADSKNAKSVGRDEITQKTQIANFKLSTPGSYQYTPNFLPGNIMSLAARSPEKSQETRFYTSLAAETPGNFSKKPKLLVTYEVDPYPFRSDWGQAYGSAQHNSALNWSTDAYALSATARKLPNTANDYVSGADPTGAVGIYSNQPVIFTQSAVAANAAFSVKQLNRNGTVLWSKGVDGVAASWPLIDEQGRLYYFSKKGNLTILDLANNGNELQSSKLADLLSETNLSLQGNATIGYDGTLYVPTEKGITALSAYPQLKIRWRYEAGINERVGPVSLSPDESKACLVSVNTAQKNGRVMLLDNMDGNRLDSSGDILGSYTNDIENYYIPSPVVRDNNSFFVLNGYDNSNRLLFFNIQKNKLSLKDEVNAGSTGANTGISQPVIDQGQNVFFILNKKMARYDPSKANKADVVEGNYSIDNAAILVTDAKSNVYALDPYNDANKLSAFRYDRDKKALSPTFDLKLNDVSFNAANVTNSADEASRVIRNTKKNLVLAPDQTLYTVTLNNVIAITPVKLSVDDFSIAGNQIKTNTVYRATNLITVTESAMSSTTNAVLSTGGTISFKPGFSVQKGGQLLCVTGKPN